MVSFACIHFFKFSESVRILIRSMKNILVVIVYGFHTEAFAERDFTVPLKSAIKRLLEICR